MHRSPLIVILIAVVIAIHLPSGCDAQPPFVPCDFVSLTRCQANFNDQLGLTASLDWKVPDQLRNQVQRIYTNGGVQGLLTVCRAFKSFKTCFNNGPVGYEACINVIGLLIDANFQTTYVTPKQAYEYVKLFTQFDFACGAGLAIYLNADSCMAGIFNTQNSTLLSCLSTYDQSIALDPRQSCVYAKIASECYSRPFMPCGLEASWWGCEYERTGTSIQNAQCTENYCQVRMQGPLAGAAS